MPGHYLHMIPAFCALLQIWTSFTDDSAALVFPVSGTVRRMISQHLIVRANSKKMRKRIADEEALFFEEQLKKEINEDREAHGKKPLKEKKEDPKDPPSCGGSSDGKEEKTVKESTTDPESGWFRKGEHKNVFAYSVQTACDKNGWILGYSVNPGYQCLNANVFYLIIQGFKCPAVMLVAGIYTITQNPSVFWLPSVPDNALSATVLLAQPLVSLSAGNRYASPPSPPPPCST